MNGFIEYCRTVISLLKMSKDSRHEFKVKIKVNHKYSFPILRCIIVENQCNNHKWKVGCSNPNRDRPKSYKQVSNSFTAQRSAIVASVTGPRR